MRMPTRRMFVRRAQTMYMKQSKPMKMRKKTNESSKSAVFE